MINTGISTGKKTVIGIADMKLAQHGETLITYALGSCIGICFFDPKIKLAALVHIMLPLNMEAGRKKAMEARGALRARITAKAAGGAKMFETAGGDSLGNIGQRNIESVHMILKMERIRLIAEDLGGSVARTLLFDSVTGEATIRSYGRPDTII